MSSIIRVSLHKHFSAVAFLLVATLAGLVLAGESVRIALAARLGKSSRIETIRKAVSLDFPDPNLHLRLGTAETYALDSAHADDGIRQLELATQLSPHETRYWSALASACEFEGDKTCAGRAVEEMLALSPMAPRTRWQAANYYLWANSQQQALGQFQRLLELDPRYGEETFQAAVRATDDPAMVYRDVLPSSSGLKLKLAYVEFLSTHNQEDFAFHVWNDLVASKADIPFSAADPYLDGLIRARQYDDALSIWNDLQARGALQPSSDSNNLVFNGGFEHFPLNAGFGWRYQKTPYVAINFNDHHPYQGKSCLRLDFSDVDNHRDEPVYEFVPVGSGRTYVLTAEVRSANITSSSAPRLRVENLDCSNCLNSSSEPVAGTTPWHQISLTFRTGPNTRLVRLSVWRARGLGYPEEILGTMWLDNVSIKTASPAENQAAQRREF